MNVYGELLKAQLENLSALPGATLAGRVWYRSDINSGTAQLDTGALVKQFLLNDQKIVVGTNVTANTNARLYRSGTGELSLVLGGDTTAEASRPSPANFATLGFALLTDTGVNLTALARKAGAIYYNSTDSAPAFDDGTNLNTLTPTTRNFIINGSLDFWQRGTSFALAATGTYSADRIRWTYTLGTGLVTLSRSADVPTLAQAGIQTNYSYYVDCTTLEAAISATEHAEVLYIMEGYDWAMIKGRTVTLSFWVKATKTGTYCVGFQNNGPDRAYVAEYTVNTTATWERKTITLTMNPTAGTDNFLNAAGLYIQWALAGGTNFQIAAGSWQTVSQQTTCSSNQVNALDSAANDFRIALIQLNIGGFAAPFMRAGFNYAAEFALCQRYYEKSYEEGTAVATSTTTGAEWGFIPGDVNRTRATAVFKVSKLTTPTITSYSTTGASAKYRNLTSTTDVSWNTITASTNRAAFESSTAAAAITNSIMFHWTAESELP